MVEGKHGVKDWARGWSIVARAPSHPWAPKNKSAGSMAIPNITQLSASRLPQSRDLAGIFAFFTIIPREKPRICGVSQGAIVRGHGHRASSVRGCETVGSMGRMIGLSRNSRPVTHDSFHCMRSSTQNLSNRYDNYNVDLYALLRRCPGSRKSIGSIALRQ